MPKELTLSRIRNTQFIDVYKNFLQNGTLENKDYELLLSLAVCFINSKNTDINHLGYRIIVQYCNKTKNYAPLYEIAINYGLYPISKMIDTKYIDEGEKNIFTEINNAFMEQFRDNNIYRTREQHELIHFFQEKTDDTVAVIAPTSYGKSELFHRLVAAFSGKRIGIVVPTKALLTQTQRRIRESGKQAGFSKIIVTPEMYNNEMSFLAVLTQERLLRLFTLNPLLYFDCLIIDEAHELLPDDERSRLLAHTIILAQKRYAKTVFKFMTPLVADENNLLVRYTTYSLEAFRAMDYIKSEKIFIYDLLDKEKATSLLLYDQFINELIPLPVPHMSSEEAFILQFMAKKNIVYLNTPQTIEEFALKLAAQSPDVESERINEACQQLTDYIDKDYNLVKCLKKGVLYHHGCVPDIIRFYVEYLYTRTPEIHSLVTTSTLLSGVNLPAQRIFILCCKKGNGNLSRSAFKNLTGRICRFNEIFDKGTGSLQYLEPHIYILKGNYARKYFDYEKFIKDVARIDKKYTDNPQNILLKKVSASTRELKDYETFIENYESGTIDSYSGIHLETAIGRACIRNGITTFFIFHYEQQMQRKVDMLRREYKELTTPDQVLSAISYIFLEGREIPKTDLPPLQKEPVHRFYAMLLDWRITNKPYKEMLASSIAYWKKPRATPYRYMGKWGDEALPGHQQKKYINITQKNDADLINLAVVRIKENQDDMDNKIIKYIEALHDVGLINVSLYKKIKYGTDNEQIICLIKNGVPPSIAITLFTKYADYLEIDTENSTASIKTGIRKAMQQNQESRIIQNTVNLFLD